MCVSNLKLELKLLARKCRVSKHKNFGEVFCGVLQASLVTVGLYDGLAQGCPSSICSKNVYQSCDGI